MRRCSQSSEKDGFSRREQLMSDKSPHSITHADTGQWPNYTYVLPHIYTRARMRLVGLGGYVPKGIITNEFFAHIASRLGSPRNAEDLERVTGLETRHVRASTLKFCREMAGADAPGLVDDPTAPRE